MTRIAILGGGIAGLAAAYELELARKHGADLDWRLYESSNRLGGIIETTHHGGFTLEGGPDAWVSEKPSARDLALELGLESDLIYSNDVTRKTYIYLPEAGKPAQLQPMPDRMRMMVPEDLTTLAHSPLFSPKARAAYAAEPARAEELRSAAPDTDESVAAFTLRHFGPKVLTRIAAPLLSGVFGGDVTKLSVRAVMPAFVAMEREHGSLILALQTKARARGNKPPQPIFTTLRNGLGSLISTLVSTLPPERLHLNRSALSLKRQGNRWLLRTTAFATDARTAKKHFHHVLIATPADTTRSLLQPLDAAAAALLPTNASSAVLATLCWPAETAAAFTIPPGFGFLVPQTPSPTNPQLLAATFVDQKFPHRAPPGARIIRAFFGGPTAAALDPPPDTTITAAALAQLATILGPLPPPAFTTVRRWPRSLPQYEVGHLDRITQLDDLIASIGNLSLLGNAYRGVGLPDLIHSARAAARKLTS
jgi:protoporphyrinogen/coproporphyrinogen III oxidase